MTPEQKDDKPHWREKLTFATINAVNTIAIKKSYEKAIEAFGESGATRALLKYLDKKKVTRKQASYLAEKLLGEIKKRTKL